MVFFTSLQQSFSTRDERVISHFSNAYNRVLNIVKKGKSIIKKNEAHILKAPGKNAVMLYKKQNQLTFA